MKKLSLRAESEKRKDRVHRAQVQGSAGKTMNLEDAKAAYESLSGKASDIVRQISLAGVGVIWIFKSGTGGSLSLEAPLLKAAFFIFLALLLDLLQYILGTIIWFLYFRHRESKGTKQSDEFLAPPQLNWPMWLLFYLKAVAMLVAYGWYIVPFLAARFGV